MKEVFTEGMNAYIEKRLAEASLAFMEVINRIPEYHVTRLFLQKSEKYILEGVPDNWEGVEIMVNK
jgi:hypothetical protein